MKSLFSLLFLFISFTVLQAQNNTLQDSVLIKKGSSWSYYDLDYLENNYWKEKQLLSPKWKKGNAPLGYNMKNINTVISYGKDSLNKNLTVYFHKILYIKDVSKFYAYKLNIRRDDGAIIYINGNEVWRTNMPYIDNITAYTKSLKIVKAKEEKEFFTKVFTPSFFINGVNIIAVELHQRGKVTTDAVFDLELIGSNDFTYLSDIFKHQNNQNVKLKDEVKDLHHRIQMEIKNAELTQIKIKLSVTKYSFYVLILLFIIIAILLYRLWNLRKKEKKEYKNIIEDLNKDKSIKEEELLSQSLRGIQNKQHIEQLKYDINLIANKSTIAKSDIKRIVQKIDFNLSQENEEWHDLQKHFNSVHSDFLNRMNKEFSPLTQTEIKHCCLIKLHLSTKEIARYLHISPRSVQASRYRIKKKLLLDESIDLKEFIINY